MLKEQIIHKDAKGRDILNQLLYTKIYLYKPYKEDFIEKKLISVVPEKIINFLTENSDNPCKFVQLFCGSGELIYAATGINFKEYEKNFINFFNSERVEDKYILQLIKSTDILF